jgi:hypothetical protein
MFGGDFLSHFAEIQNSFSEIESYSWNGTVNFGTVGTLGAEVRYGTFAVMKLFDVNGCFILFTFITQHFIMIPCLFVFRFYAAVAVFPEVSFIYYIL